MCFYKRSQPARVVFALNCLMLAHAVVIIYLAMRFNNSTLFQNPGQLVVYTQSTFYLFLSFGIVCLIASLLGFAAVRVKNRAVAVTHGVLLFPVWLVFLIGGVSLLSVSYTTSSVLSDVCQSPPDSKSSRVTDLFREYAEDIDLIISQITDENMCRFNVCPCDSTFGEEWLALDNRLLLKYARTAYMNDRDDDDGSIRLWFEQQRQEFATF